MGFTWPDRGRASILEWTAFRRRRPFRRRWDLPGELALMEDMTGDQFIGFIARMKGMKDRAEAGRLCRLLELDGRTPIRQDVQGDQAKGGPGVRVHGKARAALLDEPTSGLDP